MSSLRRERGTAAVIYAAMPNDMAAERNMSRAQVRK